MDIEGSESPERFALGVPSDKEEASGRDKLNPTWLERFVRFSGCNEDLKPGFTEFVLSVLK